METKKKFQLMAFANAIIFLSGLLTSIIYSTFYNPIAVGKFSFIVSSAALFTSISTLKFDKNIIGEASTENRSLARKLSFVLLVASCVFYALICTIYFLINDQNSTRLDMFDAALILVFGVFGSLIAIQKNSSIAEQRYDNFAKSQGYGSCISNIIQLVAFKLELVGLCLAFMFSKCVTLMMLWRVKGTLEIIWLQAISYFKERYLAQIWFTVAGAIANFMGNILIFYYSYYGNYSEAGSIFLAQRFITIPMNIYTRSLSIINFEEVSKLTDTQRRKLVSNRFKNSIKIALPIFLVSAVFIYLSEKLIIEFVSIAFFSAIKILLFSSLFQLIFAPFGTILWLPGNNIYHVFTIIIRGGITLFLLGIAHVYYPNLLIEIYAAGVILGYLLQHAVILKVLNK